MMRAVSNVGFSGGGIGLSAPGVLAQSAVPASVTGTTTETTVATIAIPANSAAKPGGRLRISFDTTQTSNANSKTFRARLAGTQMWLSASAFMNGTGTKLIVDIWIVGSASQKTLNGIPAGFGVSASASMTATTIDMTQAQNLTFTWQLANAADTATLEAYTVELLNP